MKPELIVALDVPSSKEIPQIVKSLPPEISYYKVGLELFASEGPKALEYLKANNKQIFLDLKLHDIPRTVANAVASIAQHNVNMITVHACGGREMLKAAADAAADAGECAPKIIAVTTLTSLNENDFQDLGINRSISEQAIILGGIAMAAGINGLVTSAHEVETLRKTFGEHALLVTPGIRPAPRADGSVQAGGEVADQKRVATPAMAVKGGASHLVVGRPILQADDPARVAYEILEQIQQAYTQ